MKSADGPGTKTGTKTKEWRMTSNGHKDSERRDTADRLGTKAQDAMDSLSERAQRADQEVRAAAARTAEHAREFHDQATERAEQTIRRAGSYVESNPLAFAGIAFVAGVLLSTLLRR